MVHRKALLLFSILDFSDMILGSLTPCQDDRTNQLGVQAKAKVAYLVLENVERTYFEAFYDKQFGIMQNTKNLKWTISVNWCLF